MTETRRAWNSTLPAPSRAMPRGAGLAPGKPPGRLVPLLSGSKSAATGRSGPGSFAAPRQRKDTIPPKVRKLVHARDEHWCQHCGGFFPEGIHLHHRRLKQAGGDPRPHADDACNLVSLCWTCHDWLHSTAEGRIKAEAEGFIIPNAVTEPGLHAVLVHGELDGVGQRAWPTCDGHWIFSEPEGAVA